MGDRRSEFEISAWAGGGGGWSGDWEPPPPAPDTKPPVPGERRRSTFGASERRAKIGVVAGRFLPPHRGHQYVIDFAISSSDAVAVLVFEQPGDPIPGHLRVHWLQQMYPQATVTIVLAEAIAPSPSAPERVSWFRNRLPEALRNFTHFFSSELEYKDLAEGCGAKFVPVDPQRIAVPISGTAIRTNPIENFHYICAPARPSIVRRVAVVGAESTGKSTLCAQLASDMKLTVVPEWTRVLVESGIEQFTPDAVQLAARSQIASEDALARQLAEGNTGVLICDTELRSLRAWAKRLYDAEMTDWVSNETAGRRYDLYLVCDPDIPYVGPAERNRPAEREAFHSNLMAELRATGTPMLHLTGPREERYRAAADAIVSMYAPSVLFSARYPNA